MRTPAAINNCAFEFSKFSTQKKRFVENGRDEGDEGEEKVNDGSLGPLSCARRRRPPLSAGGVAIKRRSRSVACLPSCPPVAAMPPDGTLHLSSPPAAAAAAAFNRAERSASAYRPARYTLGPCRPSYALLEIDELTKLMTSPDVSIGGPNRIISSPLQMLRAIVDERQQSLRLRYSATAA